MSKIEFNQLYFQLERDIKHIDFSTNVEFKSLALKDAEDVILFLKNDIENWTNLLKERKIACYELESLFESKSSEIVLTRLQENNLSDEKIEIIKGDIFRFVAKALMNIFLETMFRNQNRKKNQDEVFLYN